MEEIPWFEHDKDDLTSAQQEFAAVLSARARSWSVDPLDTVLLPACHTWFGELLACLDIGDPERHQGVLTVGAHYDGTTVRADKLHNQTFGRPDAPTEFTFTAAGTPTEAAHRTADWFEALLARPLVRCEWLYDGKVYALRYEYADNGRGLSEGFETSPAPPELQERFATEGVDRGRGSEGHSVGPGQPAAFPVVGSGGVKVMFCAAVPRGDGAAALMWGLGLDATLRLPGCCGEFLFDAAQVRAVLPAAEQALVLHPQRRAHVAARVRLWLDEMADDPDHDVDELIGGPLRVLRHAARTGVGAVGLTLWY